jgi:hypothetical protein
MSRDKNKKPHKKNNGFLKGLVRMIFVEDWGIKAAALLFAVAVWILFKVS